jgi:hypothetical protein
VAEADRPSPLAGKHDAAGFHHWQRLSGSGALLCLVAYAFGWTVRVNIAALDTGRRTAAQVWWDGAASWGLVVAYVISVAYCLNLFGAFG